MTKRGYPPRVKPEQGPGCLSYIKPALTPSQLLILESIYMDPAVALVIFERVAVQTGNAVVLPPASLFEDLKRMLSAGWLSMLDEKDIGVSVGGRKLYVATDLGRQLVDEMGKWMAQELPRIKALRRRFDVQADKLSHASRTKAASATRFRSRRNSHLVKGLSRRAASSKKAVP